MDKEMDQLSKIAPKLEEPKYEPADDIVHDFPTIPQSERDKSEMKLKVMLRDWYNKLKQEQGKDQVKSNIAMIFVNAAAFAASVSVLKRVAVYLDSLN